MLSNAIKSCTSYLCSASRLEVSVKAHHAQVQSYFVSYDCGFFCVWSYSYTLYVPMNQVHEFSCDEELSGRPSCGWCRIVVRILCCVVSCTSYLYWIGLYCFSSLWQVRKKRKTGCGLNQGNWTVVEQQLSTLSHIFYVRGKL